MKKTILLFILLLVPISVYADTLVVEIPNGVSQNCDDENQCYNPYLANIDVGDTIVWENNDSVAHTITSGNPTYGPDGLFDSGLIMPGDSFSLKFEESQITAYFDMVSPWMQGIVRVTEGDSDDEIIIQQVPEEKTIIQHESDYCTSEELLYGLSLPIEEIIFKYKAATNVSFRDNFSSERFESYLKDVDFNNSERAINYVDSITSSKEFATFYSDRNLIPEEEKLMIKISEKYLEFLKDGKNRFTLEMDTLYTEKKNEIDAVPMQDSRLTICGDDKIAGLEEFEQVREATEYMINHNISDIIEDWEDNLKLKQSKFPTDFPVKESIKVKNSGIPGEIGLKKGDWVKYEIILDGEGGFASMLDMMKGTYEIPGYDCSFSDIEWMKSEVVEIQNNVPTMKGSIFCNDEEYPLVSEDSMFESVEMLYIPIDITVGKTISVIDKEFEVSEPAQKMYGSKTVDVIRLYSEETEQYENGGEMKTVVESFFEKKSGLMVETTMTMEATGVPLFGDMVFTFGIDAIDFNIPRTILNQPTSDSGGGCLIATATYGSELAPQVQQLRELRDNKLLQTESGQSFMNSFNEFYYSFSPHIADYERENPMFKEAVKVTLTPLLTSLSILNHVNLDSEESVLGYGISLIILNVGMYFVAPVMIVVGIRRMA